MKKTLSLFLLLILSTACTQNTGEEFSPKLNTQALETSLELGTSFLLANQKPEGNFNYSIDALTGVSSEDDNQVRQAGALWGIASLYAHLNGADAELKEATLKGLAFYGDESIPMYPGENEGKTGSLALICLTMMDYLSVSPDNEETQALEDLLMERMSLLRSLQNDEGLFFGTFDYQTGLGSGSPSPYYDGEALLALSRFANQFDDQEQFENADRALEAMWEVHVEDALDEEPDSDETKGFYQWSTMALNELDTYEKAHAFFPSDDYLEKALFLADWMIETHRILDRTRNTAYAFEGLITAYHMAETWREEKKLEEDLQKLAQTIDTGLYKISSWQIGHPLQNSYISETLPIATSTQGGILNKKDEPELRIDVTQHQMHAVILALEWVY